jgi:hypothetical protein
MRLTLFSLLLLAGCASEIPGVAEVRPGAQDEVACKHLTLGEGEPAYQQCRQKLIESRREEARGDKAEKAESLGDQLQSSAAALFNIGR